MAAPDYARRTIAFVNLAHGLDHFVLLIFPTAVLAIAAAWDMAYGDLIGLATGAFVAFGLFSLPVGWMADRVGRRTMLAAFYLGCGACCLGLATATGETGLAIWLLALGAFTAIYHPVGSALLVSNTRRLGRDLGINGVWGNIGAASASGVTAWLAATFGWQAGFVVPGAVCLVAGLAFLALVPRTDAAVSTRGGRPQPAPIPVARPLLLAGLFGLAIVAGGFTFNITSVSLPKVIDERLGFPLDLEMVGSLTTAVFLCGAVAQFAIGRLIDRSALPPLFAGIAACQAAGLVIAALTTGIAMLAGLVVTLAAIYAQVVVNDAMVARYVPAEKRSRAYGIRYFFGFTTAGFAVPMIAVMHEAAGFELVLGVAAAFAGVIFLSALSFLLVGGRGMRPVPVAAE
ncbi:MAG: MFS transporter [Alphaproteobacteria bacterium]